MRTGAGRGLSLHRAPEGLLLASRRPPPRRPTALLVLLAAALLVAGAWLRPWAPPRAPADELRAVALVYHAPVASSVTVAGSFNDWNPRATPLVPVGEGAYRTLLWLPPGQHEYQFVIDGSRWVPDPLAPRQRDDGFGSANSVLEL